MTIAVIWQEDGFQWCAADTRLVAGSYDEPTTELAAKIYSIPIVVGALDQQLNPRQPHYWTQYGFVYAGAAAPASMTAVTASTFLQKLVRSGDRVNPPTFEQISAFVRRLANRFMAERRQLGNDGIFSAAMFGWCPHDLRYKVAYIEGRDDAGSFRVELSYPPPPQTDGDPWVVMGSGAEKFGSILVAYRNTEKEIARRVPLRSIQRMIADGQDRAVGGAASIGMAHKHGCELFCTIAPVTPGQPAARRTFNGLDLDSELGQIGQYIVGVGGIA